MSTDELDLLLTVQPNRTVGLLHKTSLSVTAHSTLQQCTQPAM